MILLGYTAIALFPVVLIVLNSFKSRAGDLQRAVAPPTPETFDLVGYATVFARASFGQYFLNSFIVTGVALFCILLTGAMAAFALAEYPFRGNALLGLYLALGIMIPIRLGTVSLLRLIVGLHLANTLVGADPDLHRPGLAAGDLHPAPVYAPGAERTEERRRG